MPRMDTFTPSVVARASTLPPELERDIFEIAARQNRTDMVRLVLVAHRVHIWIEPMLYESITVTCRNYDAFLRTLDSKPSSFFEENVKSLTYLAREDKDRILSTCRGITQFIDRSYFCANLKTILKLRLRRASFSDPWFFFYYSPRPLFRQAWADLTHLNIVNFATSSCWSWSPRLNLLPCLTHFSIISLSEDPPSPPKLSSILATNLRLQSLKVIVSDDPIFHRVEIKYEEYKSIKDPRFTFRFGRIYDVSADRDVVAILEEEWH